MQFRRKALWAISPTAPLFMAGAMIAQVDQGAITGVIKDATGASIPDAAIALTSVDNGLVLNGKSDSSGSYTFSPIKIGHYKLTVSHAGFATVTQENITIDVQQRREVDMTLQAGDVNQVVDVTAAPPILQTQEASTGQVIDAATIDQTPLNGRNWVYIAQLTAGVAPPNGSRGGGKGDFNANGQRAEQNNFILDGIDNNTNVVDFLGGASYVIKPPPDALAEFKVQTGSYSAEFGHSAGAALNASIKSGTNQIHGSLWEYVRNDAFDIREYFNSQVSKYRQNQFGATLGFPIIKNKLFFFGDTEANRIVFANPHTGLIVPTALMRQGNFSELLNPTFSGTPNGIQLYQPGSGGTTPIAGNILQASQINKTAQNILNLYPLPNVSNPSFAAGNYRTTTNDTDNTFQYDVRMDYNASAHDLAFARWSYTHQPGNRPGQLGPILDGGGFGDTGQIVNLGEQFAFSETHIFNTTLTNEVRFGYTYGHFGQFQQNINNNISAQLGLGGIPFGPLNGGLPNVAVSGISSFGSPTFYVSNEYQNNYQILDNITKVAGAHTLHAGVNFQHIRFSTQQPTQPRGSYTYSGLYTSKPGVANTGFGVADFLTDNQNSAAISNLFNTDDVRWNRAAYLQDDWKVTQDLTITAGLRYEYAQPYVERHDHQAAFIVSSVGVGTGTATYNIPISQQNVALPAKFTNLLAANNIKLNYSTNRSLVESAKLNFGPRVGLAYSPDNKTAIRAGYGIFFGGLESAGYYPNLGENFPFEFDSNFTPVGNTANPSGNCLPGNCPTDGITLATGFTNAINAGLINSISTPSLRGSDPKVKTPYSQQFNLSIQRSITTKLVADIAYVGSNGRHLIVFPDPNSPATLANPSIVTNTQNLRPFPGFGGTAYTSYAGDSNYNSLQAKIERRATKGLGFLASYTYSHSLDDAPTPLGSTGDSGYRGTNVLPINYDYSNSPFDVRHRVTVNTNWEIPVGRGRGYMNNAPRPVDYLIGGWSTSLVFRAQTGEPFTVGTSGFASAVGASAHAIRVADPFATNLTPPANGGTTACPSRVRNTTNWYNPCAFVNPALSGNSIAAGAVIRGAAALPYLGAPRNNWYGPGYERIDMSLFKSFTTFREQSFQFRADIFNVLNTPAYGLPAVANNASNGGSITGARSFQLFTPDSRFFQFSGRYFF